MTPLDITIDPGKEALAWTLGVGHIQESGLIRDVDPFKLGLFWEEQATILRHRVAETRLDSLPGRPARVWVEFMQSRGGESASQTLSKAKALLALQAIGMYLAGRLAESLGATVHPIPYRTWAGGVTEEQVQGRVLDTLTSEEVCVLDEKRYPKGLRHNLRDAAGIFLYATGRLRPGMVRQRG